ncbi:MAG: hypothetical protein M1829_002291 [Trizodia sp. TS-e1964]|nr:MAG: hypothetical protein M1829_002291 [Trizodia sp. TS-e1964]
MLHHLLALLLLLTTALALPMHDTASPGAYYTTIMAGSEALLSHATTQLKNSPEPPTAPTWLLWTFQTNPPGTPAAHALLLMPLPARLPLESSYTVLGARAVPSSAAHTPLAPVIATYTLAGWARRAPRPGVCAGVLLLAEGAVRDVIGQSVFVPELSGGKEGWVDIVVRLLRERGEIVPLSSFSEGRGGGEGGA